MAIVAVYEFENGVKCAINDACYAGKTEEELEAANEENDELEW